MLFRWRWLVLSGIACGCWLFTAGSGRLRLFPAGVCCRGRSSLAAWPAALLCAVVCCAVPLRCALSSVLWCYVAVCCRAAAPCCPVSFAGGVGLCLFPVCAVLYCAARPVVRCRFGLRCCWCLVLWCVAFLLWCLPGHSGVWWCRSGVSWCLAVPCVVLWCPAPCAVSCGAVLPCGVVLAGCAVRLSSLLVFLFPFVLFSFAYNPCCLSVPLITF